MSADPGVREGVEEDAPPEPAARLARHWRDTRRLTFSLLAAWLAVVLGLGVFARELQKVRFFGWPLSYYMGAQGALLVFLAIIGIYAWAMRRLDQTAVGTAPPSDAPEVFERRIPGVTPHREVR